MDELGCLFNHCETVEGLKHKLYCTMKERDMLKAEAISEMRKHKQYEEQLFKLMEIAYYERNKAKEELKKFAAKCALSNSSSKFHQPLRRPVSNYHFAGDGADLVIDNLSRGLVLPQKGKLLEAVMEAGPLLQDLLGTGCQMYKLFGSCSGSGLEDFSNFNFANHARLGTKRKRVQ